MPFDATTATDLAAATERMKILARAVLGNEHDAEDAAQDAWCRALATDKGPRDGTAWLAGVARNVARERRRAAVRRRARETRAAGARATRTPDEIALDRMDAVHALVEVVRELDEPYRSALVLQYVMGLSPRDAAHALGVTRPTLRTRVHRGLALVRAQLDRRSGGKSHWSAALVPLLDSDAAASAAIGSGMATLGGFTLKKWMGACIAVGVLATGAYTWMAQGPAETDHPDAGAEHVAAPPALGGGEAPRTAGSTQAEDPGALRPRPGGSSMRVALPAGGAATESTLVGHLVWGQTTRPLATEPTGPGAARLLTGDLAGLSAAQRATGELVVQVLVDGWQPRTVRRSIADVVASSGASMDLAPELEPGGGFTGVVRGPDGTPVPGARMHVVQEFKARTVGGGGKARLGVAGAARADARGRFVFPTTRAGEFEFVVTSPKHGIWRGRVSATASEIQHLDDITLRPAAHIAGVVVDAAGSPAAGIAVRARPVPREVPATSLPLGLYAEAEAVSDADGRFQLPVAGEGLFEVWVSDGLPEPRRGRRSTTRLRVDTRNTAEHRIRVGNRVPVHLAIQDVDGGALPGVPVEVFLFPEGNRSHFAAALRGASADSTWAPHVERTARITVTSADGRATMLVEPGTCVLCRAILGEEQAASSGVETSAGGTSAVDLVLRITE